MKRIATRYIDGGFVESHGREVMDIINPTDGKVIVKVTVADEEDARRAIAVPERGFSTFCRTTKEERAEIWRGREVVSAHVDDLTAVLVEEDGAAAWFCRLIIEAGATAFRWAEKAGQELPLTKGRGKTTVTLEPAGVVSRTESDPLSCLNSALRDGSHMHVVALNSLFNRYAKEA